MPGLAGMMRGRVIVTAGLGCALALGGCGNTSSPSPTGTTGPSSGPSAQPSVRPSASDGGPAASAPATIPQPSVADLPVKPDAERVDLTMPAFTHPTQVTNPLFPVSSQESVLLLGQVDGAAFRTEVTLLPETRIIDWQGQPVEVLVSQYVAFLDGRIHEVAYDFYAQADDGSVWYFGEDVFNFADGAIVDTHGTWIAGKDGPAAMIMPADPKVGDVYRPENIPGLVFEEVVVTSVGERLDGPLGPIEGGITVNELHMDGTREDKTFAPGYGEFYTASDADVEALAMAVPTDAASGTVPAYLSALLDGALATVDAVPSGDWAAAASTLDGIVTAWESVRTGDVPRLVEPVLDAAVQALVDAVDGRDGPAARQAAIDVARLALDLQLRHRPVAEIDLARFDLWLAQCELDAAAEDAAGLRGDFFSLDYVRDRIGDALEPADAASLNLQLEELLGAVTDEDFGAAADVARSIRETLPG